MQPVISIVFILTIALIDLSHAEVDQTQPRLRFEDFKKRQLLRLQEEEQLSKSAAAQSEARGNHEKAFEKARRDFVTNGERTKMIVVDERLEESHNAQKLAQEQNHAKAEREYARHRREQREFTRYNIDELDDVGLGRDYFVDEEVED